MAVLTIYERPAYHFYTNRDRAWFVLLYGEIIPSFSEEIIDSAGAQAMLYLTCTMISRVDLAHNGVSRAKDWVSVDCGILTPFNIWSQSTQKTVL